MKKREFETRKGKFTLVDGFYHINGGINLSKITEEQASEIVDEVWGKYKNYETDERAGNYNRFVCDSAIESLNSLLKSKGVHLFENPTKERFVYFEYREAERKTFYNPYIFKIK